MEFTSFWKVSLTTHDFSSKAVLNKLFVKRIPLKIPVPPKEPITAEWMKNRLEDAEKKIKALKGKEKHSKTAVSNDKVCYTQPVRIIQLCDFHAICM